MRARGPRRSMTRLLRWRGHEARWEELNLVAWHRGPQVDYVIRVLVGLLALLLGARTLLGAPGIATSNKKLLGARRPYY